jgi:6-pyruvoyltetrahydropterin/6-carboxytetrahydropterin synthase
MFEVAVEQTFAAGHALRNYRGKCENVHGHNYRVRITVQGDRLDSTGLLVDFSHLSQLIGGAVEYLDHRFINDLPPFDQLNPSAENIARYFFERVSSGLESVTGAQVSAVQVWETDTSSAVYRP